MYEKVEEHMKWNKFRIKTTTEAEDIVCSSLMDLGIQGVEVEDKIPLTQREKEQMFVDILPEIDVDDGVAYISFYLEEDEDKEKMLQAVREELKEIGTYVNVGTLCGGMVVEQVFSIPGLGRYFIQAIQTRDYPLIMGTTIFLASFIIIMNLIVDLCYKLVDPRINLSKGGN